MTRRTDGARLLTYDRIVIGETYARQKYWITDDVIRRYSQLVDAPLRTVRLDPDGLELLVAPPTLPAMWTPPRICFNDWAIPQGGIHAMQEWRSHHKIVAGSQLDLTVIAAAKYIRKERRFVAFDSCFTNRGTVVAEGCMVIIWPT